MKIDEKLKLTLQQGQLRRFESYKVAIFSFASVFKKPIGIEISIFRNHRVFKHQF